jgi:predicted nucleic acid-binding protein
LNVLFDASALINLLNAEILNTVLRVDRHTFCLGPQVKAECGPDVGTLDGLIEAGLISLADDSQLPANGFVEVLTLYDLGDGETECIAFADHDDAYVICSDDGSARAVASQRFGPERVIGSLYLVRECVRQNLINQGQARAAYELMRNRGGFLPEVAEDYFGS